jgi:protein-tyrosine phosphatase
VTPTETDEFVAHPRRHVALQTAHNFRDLGGYPTLDGRSTKWGVAYRSDALYSLSAPDWAVLDARGVRHVIDLRSNNEWETRGRFRDDLYPVTLHHFPVLDIPWADDDTPDVDTAYEFLMWAYPEMIRKGGHRLAAAVETVASVDEPVVFNCAAGKDRTGLVAMLILSSLGVPDDVVVADFELSNEGLTRLRTWAESHDSNLKERLGNAPAAFLDADGRALRDLMTRWASEHGSIRDFALSLGVSREAMEKLRARLLD